MIEVDDKRTDTLWGAKLDYDVVCAAVKMLANTDYDKRELVAKKSKKKQSYTEAMDAVLMSMPHEDNIVDLGDSWYGVRYVDSDGSKWLRVVPLSSTNLVQRDLDLDRELTKSDITALIPSITDQGSIDQWCSTVEWEARVLLNEMGIDLGLPEDEEDSDVIKVSSHAGMRYAQRILGITNEAKATEHFRVNRQQLSEKIVEGLKADTTVHLWKSPDGKDYYLDLCNTLYVYDESSRTVVTLWESDFGFTKDINRTIILSQIQVIIRAYETYTEGVEKNEKAVQRVQNRVDELADRMEVLNTELQSLKAKRDKALYEIRDYEKSTNVLEATFTAEYNKLFKKQELRGI